MGKSFPGRGQGEVRGVREGAPAKEERENPSGGPGGGPEGKQSRVCLGVGGAPGGSLGRWGVRNLSDDLKCSFRLLCGVSRGRLGMQQRGRCGSNVRDTWRWLGCHGRVEVPERLDSRHTLGVQPTGLADGVREKEGARHVSRRVA